MNRFVRHGLGVLSLVAFVLSLNAQTATESKLVGRWKQNIAKSQYQVAPGPIEATMVISEATVLHFKWKSTGAYMENGRKVWHDEGFDGAIDGRPYQYKGVRRGTQMSFVDNNGILEGTTKFPGNVKSPDGMILHDTIAVSADGNTMISQSVLTLANGKGIDSWTEVWERAPDKKRK